MRARRRPRKTALECEQERKRLTLYHPPKPSPSVLTKRVEEDMAGAAAPSPGCQVVEARVANRR